MLHVLDPAGGGFVKSAAQSLVSIPPKMFAQATALCDAFAAKMTSTKPLLMGIDFVQQATPPNKGRCVTPEPVSPSLHSRAPWNPHAGCAGCAGLA